MAAEDICQIDIKKELEEFNAWNRKWIMIGNAILWYDAIVPKGIKKKISRFIIDRLYIAKASEKRFDNEPWFSIRIPKIS